MFVQYKVHVPMFPQAARRDGELAVVLPLFTVFTVCVSLEQGGGGIWFGFLVLLWGGGEN